MSSLMFLQKRKRSIHQFGSRNFYDYQVFQIVPDIGSVNILEIPVGIHEGERIGREVYVEKICFKGMTINPQQFGASVNACSDLLRMILYIDRSPDTVTGLSTVADVLESVDIFSHYNDDNEDRFNILYDCTRDVPAGAPYSFSFSWWNPLTNTGNTSTRTSSGWDEKNFQFQLPVNVVQTYGPIAQPWPETNAINFILMSRHFITNFAAWLRVYYRHK